MALAALQAKKAAREEQERLEEKQREEDRLEEGRKQALRIDLKGFEDDLWRLQQVKEEEKEIDGDETCMIKDEVDDGKEISDKTLGPHSMNENAASLPTNAGPPVVKIEGEEDEWMHIDDLDLSDGDDNLPKTEFKQHTTKRALDSEIQEEMKSQRRQGNFMERFEELFDGVEEKDILDYIASKPLTQGENKRLGDDDSGVDCNSERQESTPEVEHSLPLPGSIKVYVGEVENDREAFPVPKREVTRHSEYFNEILSYGFNEDEPQIIILPDVDPDIFQLFANFLRFGKVLSGRHDDLELWGSHRHYHIDYEWQRLAEAWLLGEKIRSTSFKDAVVDAIALKVDQCHSVPVDMYRLLYTSDIPRYCGIKRLLVDLAVWVWNEETLVSEELEAGAERQYEFFEDLREATDVMARAFELGTRLRCRVLSSAVSTMIMRRRGRSAID